MAQRVRSEQYRRRRHTKLWDRALLVPAVWDSLKKLDPRWQARNPVIFVVEVGSVITTIAYIAGLFQQGSNELFVGQIAIWLWFTVLFANFAEAMAEARGRAQADALRKTKTDTIAKRELSGGRRRELVPASTLRVGDVVLCEANDVIQPTSTATRIRGSRAASRKLR